MSGRSVMWIVLGVGVIAFAMIRAFPGDHGPTATSPDSGMSATSPSVEVGTPSDEKQKSQEFDGSPCSSDCSGHEAGYQWAEEHEIDDVDDCDQAAETSNSPSFGEGCRSYVKENSDDDEGDEDDSSE